MKRIPAILRKAKRPPGNPKPPARVATGLYGSALSGSAFRQKRAPTPLELTSAFRFVQAACALRNARSVAAQPLRLYHTKKTKGTTLKHFSWRPVPNSQWEYLAAHPVLCKSVQAAQELVEITDHPLLDLLAWVNPWMSKFTLLELTQLYLEIVGTAYWTFAYGYGGRPVEVWPLPSWAVWPQPDYLGTEVILNYTFAIGGAQAILPRDEVLYFRKLSLYDPYIASQSPLRSGYDNTQIYDKQVDYKDSCYTNRARPDAVWIPKEDILDPNEIARVNASFFEKYSQSAGGRVWVAPGNGTLSPLSWSPQDMGEIALAKESIQAIAMQFDVPTPLILGDSANRANYDAALLDYKSNGLLARIRYLEETLNSCFVAVHWGDDLFLAFDNPVPADDAKERENNKARFAMAALSPNMLLAQQGLPPVENGDELFIPNNLTPLSRVMESRVIVPPDLGRPSDPDEVDPEDEEPASAANAEHDEPFQEGESIEGDTPPSGKERAPQEAKALSDAETVAKARCVLNWTERQLRENPAFNPRIATELLDSLRTTT